VGILAAGSGGLPADPVVVSANPARAEMDFQSREIDPSRGEE
jgi:hypothetical protein